jgi:hypothetical protein
MKHARQARPRHEGPAGLDALAFRLPEVPVLLTPVMPAAMNEAVRYVVAQAVAKVSWATSAGSTSRPAWSTTSRSTSCPSCSGPARGCSRDLHKGHVRLRAVDAFSTPSATHLRYRIVT